MHPNPDRADTAERSRHLSRHKSRGYMMRSEKRAVPASSKNGRRTPKRKRGAGFFYSLMTLLLSLLLWPLGMILLWRRKMRWSLSTKLLVSIITLFIAFVGTSYLLTMPSEDPKVTAMQDSVNDFLDDSAHRIADGYTAICDGAVLVWNDASELGESMAYAAMTSLADAADQGVQIVQSTMERLREWSESRMQSTEPQNTPTLAATDAPTQSPTATPTATPTAAPTPEVVGEGEIVLAVPSVTPDPDSAQPIGSGTLTRDRELIEASSEPDADSTQTPDATLTATPAATATASPTEATAAATAASTATATPAVTDAVATATSTATATDAATAKPAATATGAATATPTETPAPTALTEIPSDLLPDAPDQAIVYYTSNGKWYHMGTTCKNMTGARAHLLTEALERGLQRCRTCDATDESVLELESAVWTDESNRFHLCADCENFDGRYVLMELEDAIEAGYTACADCRADEYAQLCAQLEPTASSEPTVAATSEPTAAPEPTENAPTASPEPTIVVPTQALKPAGEALVYHTGNGGWYHTQSDCSGMTGATLHPLSEAAEHLKRCRKCNAPSPLYLEEYCLWIDEDELCHTSDECSAFHGNYTLLPRDAALEAGYAGCIECGADEYLQPGTTVAYIESVPSDETEEAVG